VGYFAVLYALQDQLIFPGMATQGSPESRVRPGPGCELLELATASGQRVAALYGPALLPDGRPHPESPSCPALLYFYGNAMCLAYAQNEFERFRRLGANVLIPDYLGYGQSTGKASELGCRETAETALQALVDRGFPAARIIASGWSLGGAVAIDLAARHQLGGLATFSTFTSAQEMALAIFPLPLPGWLFLHKFDSLAKLPQVSCSILLGHGRRDTIVPFGMMQKLAAVAKGPLRTFVIDDAEHNDFYIVGTLQIDRELGSFVKSLNR
jgi:pimeloyl-ACP methyl ester carboxylesterase